MTPTATTQRYANDWNSYSQTWQEQFGSRYRHLGDEWCDDGSADRRRDRRIFNTAAEPWLSPSARVLEIGPGGGKWTVQIASRVGEVVCYDVAETMLERTRERCTANGLTNVSFLLGDGQGFGALADGSIDFVFSYDVFVHIALEDTVAYVADAARVLRPGGVAVIHHAVNDVADAWDRIESHNDWYRGGATLGQYYYHSHAALRALYERGGFEVLSTWTEYCTVIFTVRKSATTMAPTLEQALRRVAVADTPDALRIAVDEARAAEAAAHARFVELLAAIQLSRRGGERYDLVAQLRRLFRGA